MGSKKLKKVEGIIPPTETNEESESDSSSDEEMDDAAAQEVKIE
jgi:hypothetical protein